MAVPRALRCLIVANLYMEEVERRALSSFKRNNTEPIGSDMWTKPGLKIKTQEVEAFTKHLNSRLQQQVYKGKHEREHLEKDGGPDIETYWKPTYTDQYVIFNSHHP